MFCKFYVSRSLQESPYRKITSNCFVNSSIMVVYEKKKFGQNSEWAQVFSRTTIIRLFTYYSEVSAPWVG